ncbi:MAG: ribonuclease P protein component [Desulfitobacteriia bacterium]|jgi:ribonuclease P protein component
MLPKTYRMQNKANFQTVFAKGKSYASKHVVIYIFKGLPAKYGIIASKKIGNAVKRNRAKRLLREVIRLNQAGLTVNCQMILIARTFINGAAFREVEKSVLYIWRKAGIYHGENS